MSSTHEIASSEMSNSLESAVLQCYWCPSAVHLLSEGTATPHANRPEPRRALSRESYGRPLYTTCGAVDELDRGFDSSTIANSWAIVNFPAWQRVPRLNVWNNDDTLLISPRWADE